MAVFLIIPARFASVRLPGKALADIGGKPMIQHVWERAVESGLGRVAVATDDARIASAAARFGAEALLTSPDCPSGTARCAEAIQHLSCQPDDVVINVQGDEPFARPEHLRTLAAAFDNAQVALATLATPCEDPMLFSKPSTVKVALDQQGFALYFSRAPIPHVRDAHPGQDLQRASFHKHTGVYAYRAALLSRLAQLSPTPLEQAENLEQLRWMEHGHRIRVLVTSGETPTVDTPEDLELARHWYASSQSIR
jgi:3-deoxy-manno-octulosonate cytidylyltransferase (CMP-KDO synthetase)